MIWRNELGGLTFAIADTYVKWNPFNTEIDLIRERDRMVWLAERHASPRVIDFGFDDQAQWLVSEAMPGEHAVGDRWADLAIASLSLDWNFGEGNQDEFFDAYGVARDDDRIRYYRGLWHLES